MTGSEKRDKKRWSQADFVARRARQHAFTPGYGTAPQNHGAQPGRPEVAFEPSSRGDTMVEEKPARNNR